MNTLFSLVPLIVFLPVLGLLINIAFGGKMSEKAIGVVASAAAGLAFVVWCCWAWPCGAAVGQHTASRSQIGSASARLASPGASAWIHSR